MIAEMLSEPHPLNGAARDPDDDLDSVEAPVDETDDVTGASEQYDLDDDEVDDDEDDEEDEDEDDEE